MYTWQILALALTTLIGFGLLFNEVRLRERDAKHIDLLQRQIQTHHYLIESLRAVNANLEAELRAAQQGHIVDLPIHLPSTRIYRN